jgi:uncharacterized membrane-anchored protein YhcB (DUF1043 family)
MPEVIAVFIPIIITLVVGIVIVVHIYLQSREKQILIEKGLSTDEIKKFLEQKRDGLSLLKIGIISIAFGIGLGFGMFMEDTTSKEYWIPLSLFIGTGIGFVVANVMTDKIKKKNN